MSRTVKQVACLLSFKLLLIALGLSLDFVDAALVAPAFELGVEPFADDLEREFGGHRACADGDAVGIVVGLGRFGGPFVPAESAADAFDFVGDDGFAISASTEDDAEIGFTGGDGLSCWANEVWIVAGFVGVAAEVEDGVAAGLEKFFDRSLEGKAGVVGADGDSER